MKVTHLNFSDTSGGAARAAYRIHRCLLQDNVNSEMWVNTTSSGDWTVKGPSGKRTELMLSLRNHAASPLRRLLRTTNPIIHSPAILPSRWPKRINSSDSQVINLHWVAAEMLSIKDIARITKPVVWTLHDMWAFCGAEHLSNDDRWRDGYRPDNRPTDESGFDLNLWTWQRKRKYWRRPIHIVTPSRWLANCVNHSILMRDWPVTVIANPIDTEHWQPIEQSFARALLHLPPNVPLLLFGAIGGSVAPWKGFDLLLGAIARLRQDSSVSGLQVIVFGQHAPKSPLTLGFPIHYTGHLHDDLSLRALYSAADVMVVPSRQEAFGQTASEAHACGTPVVAFNTGGLPDIVNHRETGYLAQPFDTEDLANGILWTLAQRERGQLRTAARELAVERFAYPVIAGRYRGVYETAVEAEANAS